MCRIGRELHGRELLRDRELGTGRAELPESTAEWRPAEMHLYPSPPPPPGGGVLIRDGLRKHLGESRFSQSRTAWRCETLREGSVIRTRFLSKLTVYSVISHGLFRRGRPECSASAPGTGFLGTPAIFVFLPPTFHRSSSEGETETSTTIIGYQSRLRYLSGEAAHSLGS